MTSVFPRGWFQAPAPVINERDSLLVQINSIPQFARYGPMCLVESFTVICISAPSHFFSTTESHFAEPIRIGKCLAGHANYVGLSVSQDRFSLLESANSARSHNGSC